LLIDFLDFTFPAFARIHVIVNGSEFPVWRPRKFEDPRQYDCEKSKGYTANVRGVERK
jgi:hypothetical protein